MPLIMRILNSALAKTIILAKALNYWYLYRSLKTTANDKTQLTDKSDLI